MCEDRRDIGEYANWKDAGCELHSSCLSCPFPRCIDEEPRGRQRRRLNGRSISMLEMRMQGKVVKEIAACFGVSVRTVQRALQCNKRRENETANLGLHISINNVMEEC
jgi:hypothetical protein